MSSTIKEVIIQKQVQHKGHPEDLGARAQDEERLREQACKPERMKSKGRSAAA